MLTIPASNIRLETVGGLLLLAALLYVSTLPLWLYVPVALGAACLAYCWFREVQRSIILTRQRYPLLGREPLFWFLTNMNLAIWQFACAAFIPLGMLWHLVAGLISPETASLTAESPSAPQKAIATVFLVASSVIWGGLWLASSYRLYHNQPAEVQELRDFYLMEDDPEEPLKPEHVCGLEVGAERQIAVVYHTGSSDMRWHPRTAIQLPVEGVRLHPHKTLSDEFAALSRAVTNHSSPAIWVGELQLVRMVPQHPSGAPPLFLIRHSRGRLGRPGDRHRYEPLADLLVRWQWAERDERR